MPFRRSRPIGWPDRTPAFLGGALILLTAICLLLGTSISRQINKHDIAPTDANVFGLAQIEVEFLKFDRALRAAATGQGDLVELRLWFDIFYSRVVPPETSRTFRHYIDDPDFVAAYEEVRSFVQDALPLIDAPDSQLVASIPELLAMSEAVEPAVRESALIGLSTASVRHAALWDMVSTSLRATGRFLAAGVAGLVLLSAALLVVFRMTRNRAREIESQSSQMRTIVETSQDAIFVLDFRGRIEMINEVAQALFELDPDEVVGRDMRSLLFEPGEDWDRLAFLAEGRRPVPDERRLEATTRVGTGRAIPIEISVDATKTPKGWAQVAFLRDISQRRETEAELRDARDRALAGERSKADFLAVMSHEMRTPLNGVLGALELLRDTALDPRQQKLVNTIECSGELMLGLVEDVLDIAKFDAGRVEPEPRSCDPRTIVDSVVGALGAMAASAGLSLSWTCAPEVPERIVTDPKMLRHVLLNLVGNAIKFTREGRVDIALGLKGAEALAIRVSDTGIGISPEDRERIFGAFETADPTYARRHRGTGLGLGIAKRIMDRLDGSIGVDSEQGVGSTFWVHLPIGATAVQGRVGPRSVPCRPLRVLLIEDNDINRLVARDFLRSEGHEVVEARNGVEGVARAEKEVFDAILTDVSMPVMDGPTAARRIRFGGGPSSRAPIIGLTAHLLPHEVEAFRAAGMDACVTKPFDRATLSETVKHATQGAAEGAEPLCRPDMIESMLATLGPDRTARLFQMLSQQMERDLPAISDTARSLEDRRRMVHDLAGAAASFGLMRLHAALCRVERSIKTEGAVPRQSLRQLPGLWHGSSRALEDHLPRVA